MKKIITISVAALIMILNYHPDVLSAAAPSPTTVIEKLKQIEILKEKIATKVAEIRQSEKSAVTGTVKSIKDNIYQITGKSLDQSVTKSDDTVFYKITNQNKSDPLDSQTINKIKIGEEMAALGYFDSNHNTFLAKYIYLFSAPLRIFGKVIEKDTENYTISVSQPQGNILVDIETVTKIYIYTPKSGLIKGGFSKLNVNDAVSIFATVNPKEENRMSAVKILDFTFTKEASPSAKSAIK